MDIQKDMIFNRTNDDVTKALELRETKVKLFQTLTTAETEIMERGSLTTTTLNRIEQATVGLASLFRQLGYTSSSVVNRYWGMTARMVFDESDMDRILKNLDILKAVFFETAEMPPTPNKTLNISNLNDIEKILFEMDVLINDVKSNYRECGAYECGEEGVNND